MFNSESIGQSEVDKSDKTEEQNHGAAVGPDLSNDTSLSGHHNGPNVTKSD